MKLKGYDNFFLVVDDLEKAKKYYKDILGLEIKFDFSDMGMVAFNIGNEEAAIILKEKNKFPDTKQTIWFIVDNVSEEYEKMKNKNVKLLTPPCPIRTGNAVEFEDPFGNRFGIMDYKKG